MAARLTGEIRDEVVRTLQYFFHPPSNTHIVYCMVIGGRGIRAIGDFADEAMDRFTNELDSFLSNAHTEEIERLHHRVISKTDVQRTVSGSNGLTEFRPSLTLFKDQLQALNKTTETQSSAQQIVQDALQSGLRRVNQIAANCRRAQIRELVTTRGRPNTEMKRSRNLQNIEVEPTLHARLRLTAHEIGVDPTELCRFAIAEELNARSRARAEAMEAEGKDRA